jgi:hypothetical protein
MLCFTIYPFPLAAWIPVCREFGMFINTLDGRSVISYLIGKSVAVFQVFFESELHIDVKSSPCENRSL